MKLNEHVNYIRERIYKAFDKRFAALGLKAKERGDNSFLNEKQQAKRQKLEKILQSHEQELGHYKAARTKVLDELTFTLFNRLAAIKVMEAHRLFPPVVTQEAEHGNRSFGHKKWLEQHPEMRSEEREGLRAYFVYEFDQLGESIPLFHRNYPYALLPDTISLYEIVEAFNAIDKDEQIEADIWQSDDILGWLYESYNNYKKEALKAAKSKTEYDKVSVQSQVYTPRWVVEFLVQNSLGKLYLEMFPNSKIRGHYKIANAPNPSAPAPRTRKPLTELRLIDPAMGSGNFLLYAFDFFYALYLDQIKEYGELDYEEEDIPQLIIEHNLHGVDLDDRAAQLAQLGLWIKAKRKNRRLKELRFNVVSSDFFLPDYEEVKHIFEQEGNKLPQEQRELIQEIWSDLQQAYKFGSLVQVGEKLQQRINSLQEEGGGKLFIKDELQGLENLQRTFLDNLQKAVDAHVQQEQQSFLSSKTRDAITFLRIISQRYDVATANPPYTDSSSFGPELKKFVQANYKKPYKFHTNLYATFIKRCFELTNEEGKVAMIHPRTFMFIKTFEDVRSFILHNTHINVFVDFSLGDIFGYIMVDPAFYVLEKKLTTSDKSLFISLDQYTRTPKEKLKKAFALQAIEDFIEGQENEHNYVIDQSKLKIIESYPFIYWISDSFREKFGGSTVNNILKNCQGLATANNDRFLRFWWELGYKENEVSSDEWKTYAKGGSYQKWSGNLWLKVFWKNDGHAIKNLRDKRGKQKSRPQNESVYFKEGITYSASGAKGASFRLLPEGCIFDVGGSSIFPLKKFRNNYYSLAFFNSKLVKYVTNCLNPTVNSQVGDIKRIPFVIPSSKEELLISNLSKMSVSVIDDIRSYYITEPIFRQSIFGGGRDSMLTQGKAYLNRNNYMSTTTLVNEAIINEKIFDIYELTASDKAIVIAQEGPSIGSLPVSPAAKRAYLEAELEEFPLKDIRAYIEALPEQEFSTEERAEVEAGFPKLYKTNNDFEAFCIRHAINPINIWYWFRETGVVPEQRMQELALEFLTDLIREILMEDEDGIVPLVPNAGERVLLERIERKFEEKGFSRAQFSSFSKLLGKELNSYLYENFFADLSDHLNLFMYLPKTPFIWQLSSGSAHGFDAYIIIYKWNRDKLLSIRSRYVEQRRRALENRQSDLGRIESPSAAQQAELETLYEQLQELRDFEKKVDDLLASGYDPVLDDGVGKNIAPLQERGLVPYDVLTKSQLEKYLNADW